MFGNRLSDLNTLKRKFRVAKCLNLSFHLTANKLLVIRTIPLILYVEVSKVKCTLVQALRLCTGRTAHRGSRGIALLFHDRGTRRG